jgi:acetyl-CoA C-acetyltransferase
MSAREAVICEPVRTPIGRYGGMFKALTAVDLGVAALRGLLDRTGVTHEAIEDVILGHCYPNSEAPAIGRVVALDAGLPVTVPGMQVAAAGPVCRPSARPASKSPAGSTISWWPAAPRA